MFRPCLNRFVVGRSVVVTCEDVVLKEEQAAEDAEQAGVALSDMGRQDEKKVGDPPRKGVANSERAGGDC